ncbi:MAG: hypothetical protein NTW50_02660 [Candidatus Berkelbacteria bacterium]|nr:hypothetical protein [Candidatus Berkelbacteria bacterium]
MPQKETENAKIDFNQGALRTEILFCFLLTLLQGLLAAVYIYRQSGLDILIASFFGLAGLFFIFGIIMTFLQIYSGKSALEIINGHLLDRTKLLTVTIPLSQISLAETVGLSQSKSSMPAIIIHYKNGHRHNIQADLLEGTYDSIGTFVANNINAKLTS